MFNSVRMMRKAWVLVNIRHGCHRMFSQSVRMSLKPVDIDGTGKFKYILVTVLDGKKESTIVRGYGDCGFHGDIFDRVEEEAQKLNPSLKLDCPGGGRIIHDPSAKTMKVYGYSQGYGKADHSKAVTILKGVYPDYNITWSDDGY